MCRITFATCHFLFGARCVYRFGNAYINARNCDEPNALQIVRLRILKRARCVDMPRMAMNNLTKQTQQCEFIDSLTFAIKGICGSLAKDKNKYIIDGYCSNDLGQQTTLEGARKAEWPISRQKQNSKRNAGEHNKIADLRDFLKSNRELNCWWLFVVAKIGIWSADNNTHRVTIHLLSQWPIWWASTSTHTRRIN